MSDNVFLSPQVKVWEIPPHGVFKTITTPWKELQGHSRRVGLIEWHPTANNILFSTAYDYQVTQGHLYMKYCNIFTRPFKYYIE